MKTGTNLVEYREPLPPRYKRGLGNRANQRPGTSRVRKENVGIRALTPATLEIG